jgi:two-component system chemotaxis response regulator CheB
MAAPRIVVIGASSGGIEALRTVVGGLEPDFPAPICVVVHTSPQSPGMIELIMSRAGRLPASNAADGERLQPGRIYIAPPDRHLLVEPGTLRLTRGPKENRFRPAIDPLFRSAAQVYGPGAVGVVLSGGLDDGTAGLRSIKQLGGAAIVQDPADALFPSMPQSAIKHVAVDHIVASGQLAPLLSALVKAPVDEAARITVPSSLEVEVKIAREDNALESGVTDIGEFSPFACPECHGVLLRLKDASLARFRCHTGHAYTADSLIAAVNEGIEESLWSTMRALQEGVLLLEHLQAHLTETGGGASEALRAQVASTKAQVEAVRKVVTDRAGLMTSTSIPVPE